MQGLIELTIVMALILYWSIDESEQNRLKVVIILAIIYMITNGSAVIWVDSNSNLSVAISTFETILRPILLWALTKDGIKYFVQSMLYLLIYNLVSVLLLYMLKLVFLYDRVIENSIYAIHSHSVSLLYMIIGLGVIKFLIKKKIIQKLPYKIVRNIICIIVGTEYLAIMFVLLNGEFNAGTVNHMMIIESYSVIIAVFFIIWYRRKSVEDKKRLYEAMVQKNYLNYKKVYAQQQAVRNFRHNLANHIEILSNLNNKGDNSEKNKYEKELIDSYAYYFKEDMCGHEGEENIYKSITMNKNIVLIGMCFIMPIIITLVLGINKYEIYQILINMLLFELVGGVLYFSFRVKLQEDNSKQMKELLDKGNEVKDKWDKIQKSISECINASDNNEAETLDVQKLSEIVNVRNISFTTNEIVNVMLNGKKEKCDEKGIKSEWNIDIPVLHNISEVDLIEILSNLLDNAIEACLRVENQEKKITVNAKNRANFWALSIENTKNKNEKPIKSKFKTTKNGEHGYGMDIIKSIVKKYKGVMEYKDLGDTFRVELMISIDKS